MNTTATTDPATSPFAHGLHGYFLEDLYEGMSTAYAKTLTEADVVIFAGISGDNNPMHINEEFASETMFKGRIVHGMLTSSLISTVIGTRLPGPGCIYIDQQLKFTAPVAIGDTVTATATVLEIIPERRRVILKTVCTVKGKVVVDGVATIKVESRDKK